MKLKVLLAPFLIILDIVLAIWYIYPAITDSVGGTGVYQKLKTGSEKQALLEDIAQKRTNVSGLSSYISANPSYGDALLKYLPEAKGEDEIVSGLNAIVSSSGSVAYGISIDEKASDSGADEQLAVSDDGSLVDVAAGLPASVPSVPKPKLMSVELAFAGDYENMKSILASLYRLKRFEGITEMSVSPMKDEGETLNGMLQTKMTMDFAYYPKSKGMKDSDIDAAVFSSPSFDVSSLDDLMKTRTGEVVKASIDQVGRTNPFATP